LIKSKSKVGPVRAMKPDEGVETLVYFFLVNIHARKLGLGTDVYNPVMLQFDSVNVCLQATEGGSDMPLECSHNIDESTADT